MSEKILINLICKAPVQAIEALKKSGIEEIKNEKKERKRKREKKAN